MKSRHGVALTILAILGFCLCSPVQAQSSTDAQIIFADELREQAREQLLKLLSEYDLDPWIFTRKVKIVAGDIIPHSHPILTIDTEFLNDDARQLDIFIHEQIHWFAEAHEKAVEQAIVELREGYPNPPSADEIGVRSEHSIYLHLIVNWLELHAMSHLIGKEAARELLTQKDYYSWIYDRVLKDTRQIEAILEKHDLIIDPNAT